MSIVCLIGVNERNQLCKVHKPQWMPDQCDISIVSLSLWTFPSPKTHEEKWHDIFCQQTDRYWGEISRIQFVIGMHLLKHPSAFRKIRALYFRWSYLIGLLFKMRICTTIRWLTDVKGNLLKTDFFFFLAKYRITTFLGGPKPDSVPRGK